MAKYTNLKALFTAIADAIRSKTGETSGIVADNFPDAIRAIETHEIEDAIISGVVTSYNNDRVKYIRDYAFSNCIQLSEVHFANALTVGFYAFAYCNALTKAYIQSANYIYDYAFIGSNLREIYCPFVRSIGNRAFMGTNLEILDVYGGFIGDSPFADVREFKALILRDISSLTPIISDAFQYSNIAAGTAYVYVPSALVEQYKAEENWSKYADQIRALEDYTVDGTTTGAFDKNKI